MDRWDNGSFWIEFFRVCFLRAETLNFILDYFEDESLLNIGREIGEKLHSTMENSVNFPINCDTKQQMIGYLNKFSGWGWFSLENNAIIITMPIFTKPHLIQGYLEGLFHLNLTLLESHPDRMAFKISQKPHAREIGHG